MSRLDIGADYSKGPLVKLSYMTAKCILACHSCDSAGGSFSTTRDRAQDHRLYTASSKIETSCQHPITSHSRMLNFHSWIAAEVSHDAHVLFSSYSRTLIDAAETVWHSTLDENAVS